MFSGINFFYFINNIKYIIFKIIFIKLRSGSSKGGKLFADDSHFPS